MVTKVSTFVHEPSDVSPGPGDGNGAGSGHGAIERGALAAHDRGAPRARQSGRRARGLERVGWREGGRRGLRGAAGPAPLGRGVTRSPIAHTGVPA